MAKSLINVYQSSPTQITHIYTENNICHREDVDFKPFLGYRIADRNATTWSDIFGNPVKVRVFESIKIMNDWKKENKDTIELFGDVRPAVQFMAATYRNDIELNKLGIKIFNLDVEVYVEGGGFPKPEEAKHPINAITINEMMSDTYITFACGDYTPTESNHTYIKCADEKELLKKFLEHWNRENPQIITGWNINTFDIPYIVKRIENVFNIDMVKYLSIDRKVTERKTRDTTGNEIITYKLQGHIIWDYMELYKKYTQETRESYTLQNIAVVEKVAEKIDYHDEYDSLNELYLKDFKKFIEYNVRDTKIISDLDGVLNYINVAMSIMQKARCQPEDIFGTVQPWDCIIYNELLKNKIMCPPNKNHTKMEFVGGFVGDPLAGLYEWLFVTDIVSSYPNQLISFNMSMETIVNDHELTQELMDIRHRYGSIEKCVDIDQLEEIKEVLKKYNYSFTSNGQFFKNDKEGILPKIFSKFFKERKEYKKLKDKYDDEGNKKDAKIAHLYQYTLKILLNSGYGALANNFSRYFDIRIAEAITSNGQVCCRGAIKHITETFPIKCVYADTDSNFYDLNPIIQKRFGDKPVSNEEKLKFVLKFSEQCIDPELKVFYNKMKENMNMRVLTIGMEPECVADVSLFVAKKRYIMNKVWDEGKWLLDKPKRKIRGVEIVRSSTPMIVRNRLKEAVDIIFTTKSNDAVIDFIDNFREEFYKLPIEEVAFPRSVTMGEYTLSSKSLPIGVKSALTYNQILRNMRLDKFQPIADGDKIKFAYIKQPNIVGSHVIGFINRMPNEVKKHVEVDYNMQFQKAFLDPLENILSCIGWHIEHVSSLEDFFS